MILRNFLIKATDSLLENPNLIHSVKEENFHSIKVNASQSEIFSNKAISIFENPVQANINSTLVNVNGSVELTDDFIIKINLLQLRYFLELQFVVRNFFKLFIK